MSLSGLHRFHPSVIIIKPEQRFELAWANPSTEPRRSPQEERWWRDALAEVDAICTALFDA